MLTVIGRGGQAHFRIVASWAMNMLAKSSISIAVCHDFPHQSCDLKKKVAVRLAWCCSHIFKNHNGPSC